MGWHVEKVFELARRERWSDSELARRMGVSHSTVSRVRRGLIKPSLEFREGLKRAFPDHDPDRLIWHAAEPMQLAREAV